MNENFSWVAAIILLATINTGGGSQVGGDVEAGNNVAMRDIIYADQYVRRSHVDHRLRDQRDEMRNEIMGLRRGQNYQWIAIGFMAVLFLFTVTIASGVLARRFDLLGRDIERQFDLIDAKIERGFDKIDQGRIP